MNCLNVHILSVQKFFFPLHDAILFQGHGKYHSQDLHLGVVEWKFNKNLINTEFQFNFDHLLQLHLICLGNIVK
jgi:hypothetical protein